MNAKTWMQTATKINRTERGMWGVWEDDRLVVRADTERAAKALAETVRAFGTARTRVEVRYMS